jgi:predicted DNA-binding transcriptional regulator YafY
MANDPQLVRAVALVHALVTTKRGVALKQLADRRGWNLRALYRDIKALERAGFPVKHEHGWWSLPPDWLPPGAVGVSRDELIALYVVRNLIPGLQGTPVGRDLTSLWQKLSTRGAQTQLVPGDDVPFGTRAPSPIDYIRHASTLEKLHDAMARKRAAWIRYRDRNGVETTRTIEPGYLHIENGEALYVPSWCRLRNGLRVFAVHRILAIDLLDERAPSRAAAARAALERAFRLWHRDHVEHVVIRFMPDVAGEIRERRWHTSERLVDDREGGVYLHLDIAAPEELERWLLGYGASARVIEPAGLAERVHATHEAAAKVGSVVAAASTPARAPKAGAAPRRAGRTGRTRPAPL